MEGRNSVPLKAGVCGGALGVGCKSKGLVLRGHCLEPFRALFHHCLLHGTFLFQPEKTPCLNCHGSWPSSSQSFYHFLLDKLIVCVFFLIRVSQFLLYFVSSLEGGPHTRTSHFTYIACSRWSVLVCGSNNR